MSDTRPPTAAFDDAVIAAAAEAAGRQPDALATLVARHQQSVRDLPGVEDIVYEWRNHFHRDPLVHREPGVYVLALPAHVWDEFADALDASEAELDVLVAVHDRQARVIAPDADVDRFDADAALVLTRP